MNDNLESGRAELTRAFQAFNSISDQLRKSYVSLERRVADLTQELEQTRREREREASNGRELAGRLNLLLDTLPAGVVVVDPDGRIAQTNPAADWILGSSHLGESWVAVAKAVFEHRLTTRGDWIHADGRRIAMLTNRVEQPPQKIIVLTDVTATREIEELVNRNERLSAMGKMAATLAHQIRTPLASALLYISQLKGRLAGTVESEMVGKSVERMRQLDRLVQDMLVFARGTGPGERVRVAELFRDVDEAIRSSLPADAHLIIDGTDALVELEGNRTALSAALTNLVRNAVEAAPGIVVTMRAEVRANRVRFAVEDNGPGIDPALRSRMFEPFVSTRSAGTGLGLAVVKTVTEAHVGELDVRSSAEHGTCFGLDLPRHPLTPSVSRDVA